MKLEAKLKLEKELPEFVAEVSGLSVQDLDARLAQLAKDLDAVQESQDNDEGIIALREGLHTAVAPYMDAKKTLRKKTAYIIELVKVGA